MTLPNINNSLFAPANLEQVKARLREALELPCDCNTTEHENAIHDLVHDDIPVLIAAVEKLEQLRTILKPVIAWYEQVLRDGEPDSSYLYDETWSQFENLSRGDHQSIIEILRDHANPKD